jgi:ABC-type glycerol-3-phosphate transport system substrate-binding protein
VETVIDWVVAPVDQRLPLVEDDVSVTALPVQNAVGPLMTGVAGGGLTVMTAGAEAAWQPLASVTVTL